jgi:hypothetical protein
VWAAECGQDCIAAWHAVRFHCCGRDRSASWRMFVAQRAALSLTISPRRSQETHGVKDGGFQVSSSSQAIGVVIGVG